MIPRPSYVTTMTDEQWRLAPIPERALHVARGLDDVREAGRNAGTWVGRFLRSVGLDTGYAWCAAFVYFCLITAGADPKKLPPRRKAAGVIGWVRWAQASGRLRNLPVRGCTFFWLDGANGHTGFVLYSYPKLGMFTSIEGNTNAMGSRDGDGVYDKKRRVLDLAAHEQFGFIDLGGLGDGA